MFDAASLIDESSGGRQSPRDSAPAEHPADLAANSGGSDTEGDDNTQAAQEPSFENNPDEQGTDCGTIAPSQDNGTLNYSLLYCYILKMYNMMKKFSPLRYRFYGIRLCIDRNIHRLNVRNH